MKNIFDFGVLLNLIKKTVCNIFGASKIYFDWDSTKTYDANVLITYKDNNGISHLYLSKQPVPVGVQITNTNYWELVEGMIRDTVKYTEQLGKTSLEKTIARSNIGAASDTKVLEVENLAKDAVKYTEQLGKTSLEKTIARSNIGAASDTKMLEVESIAKGAQRAFSIENYQSLVSFLNISSQGVYSLGQSIYVKTLDVPDLWIYKIEDTKVTYQYVSDEAFVSDLTTYGSVKMGYYRVAMLETLKINLDNYVTTTDYASLDTGGVVKVDMSKGIKINNGTIETIPAESLNLNEKTGSYSIVTPTNLDIAVKATTHQDMSDEYDINTIVTNASYTESKGYLPVSYDAVKGYVDTKAKPNYPVVMHSGGAEAIVIESNTLNIFGTVSVVDLVPHMTDDSIANEAVAIFTSSSTPTALTYPTPSKWFNGEPIEIKANKTYMLSFIYDGSAWLIIGGEFDVASV